MSYGPPFNAAELASRRKTDQIFATARRLYERQQGKQRKPRSKS